MSAEEEGKGTIDVSEWLSKIDKKNCSLDVSNLSLSDAVGQAIVRSLPASLVKLELGGNNFSSMTASALAVLLRKSSVQLISLDSNPLTSGKNGIECFKMLAKALEDNFTLRTLSLWRCGIGREGCAALSSALSHNDTLISLELGYNNCHGSDARSIKEKLSSNRKLYNDQLAAEAQAKELERKTALLKLQAEEEIQKEKDVMEWLAGEKAKREESRRVEVERRRLEEQKEHAYKQNIMMEEERMAATKTKKKDKGKKGKKKK